PTRRSSDLRLYEKNGDCEVICAGSVESERKVVEAAGGVWIQHRNFPLGAKWNACFREAKQYDPDACLFVGSSDWVSDNWIEVMRPHSEKYHITGTAGCHFLHLSDPMRLCHWPGYTGRRQGESIGIGRMINREMLERMGWEPFNGQLDRSLDFSMMEKCSKLAGNSHLVVSPNALSVSISTDVWPNKHRFFDHYHGRLPSTILGGVSRWVEKNFPEANLIFNDEHKDLNHERHSRLEAADGV